MEIDFCSLFFLFKGWVQYGNHVYRLFTEQKTWDNAKVGKIKSVLMRKKSTLHLNVSKKLYIFQAYCKAKEAYLAEIESLDENNWIKQFLYRMGKTAYSFAIET